MVEQNTEAVNEARLSAVQSIRVNKIRHSLFELMDKHDAFEGSCNKLARNFGSYSKQSPERVEVRRILSKMRSIEKSFDKNAAVIRECLERLEEEMMQDEEL